MMLIRCILVMHDPSPALCEQKSIIRAGSFLGMKEVMRDKPKSFGECLALG